MELTFTVRVAAYADELAFGVMQYNNTTGIRRKAAPPLPPWLREYSEQQGSAQHHHAVMVADKEVPSCHGVGLDTMGTL